MNSKKLMLALGLIVIASMALAACQPAATPEVIVETVVVTQEVPGGVTEVVQVVTPTPEPVGPRTLVICQGQEPDTLFPMGGSMVGACYIQGMLWDGGSIGGWPGGIGSWDLFHRSKTETADNK